MIGSGCWKSAPMSWERSVGFGCWPRGGVRTSVGVDGCAVGGVHEGHLNLIWDSVWYRPSIRNSRWQVTWLTRSDEIVGKSDSLDWMVVGGSLVGGAASGCAGEAVGGAVEGGASL